MNLMCTIGHSKVFIDDVDTEGGEEGANGHTHMCASHSCPCTLSVNVPGKRPGDNLRLLLPFIVMYYSHKNF